MTWLCHLKVQWKCTLRWIYHVSNYSTDNSIPPQCFYLTFIFPAIIWVVAFENWQEMNSSVFSVSTFLTVEMLFSSGHLTLALESSVLKFIKDTVGYDPIVLLLQYSIQVCPINITSLLCLYYWTTATGHKALGWSRLAAGFAPPSFGPAGRLAWQCPWSSRWTEPPPHYTLCHSSNWCHTHPCARHKNTTCQLTHTQQHPG